MEHLRPIRNLFSKILTIWSKLDGYKILIGLILNTIADHLIPEATLSSDIVYILAYFFMITGTIHKGVKSEYANKTLGRFKTFRKGS